MKYLITIILALSLKSLVYSQNIEKVICYCEKDTNEIQSIFFLNSDSLVTGKKRNFDCRSGKIFLIENYTKGNLNGIKKEFKIVKNRKTSFFGKNIITYKKEIESKENYEDGKLNGIAKYLNYEGADNFTLFNKKSTYKNGVKHGKEVINNLRNGFKIINVYQSGNLYSSDTSDFLLSSLLIGRKYKLHTYGMPSFDPPKYYYNKLNNHERLYYKSVAGCVVSYRIIKNCAYHNKRYINKLEKKYGKNWKEKFVPKF